MWPKSGENTGTKLSVRKHIIRRAYWQKPIARRRVVLSEAKRRGNYNTSSIIITDHIIVINSVISNFIQLFSINYIIIYNMSHQTIAVIKNCLYKKKPPEGGFRSMKQIYIIQRLCLLRLQQLFRLLQLRAACVPFLPFVSAFFRLQLQP